MHSRKDLSEAIRVREAVRDRRPSLYEPAALAEDPTYFSPEQLEAILSSALVDSEDLADLPVRTRSKVAKTVVAETLGYLAPLSFQKTQPRLPHPNLDVYVQQANNLQVWNAELDAARRYVVIGLDSAGIVHAVRVIAGADLTAYDTTGTLTSKFQAARLGDGASKLVSRQDTFHFSSTLQPSASLTTTEGVSPVARPLPGKVLSIAAVYDALLTLIGATFADPGLTQERLRGEVVHRAACQALGLANFADNGQFPDILSQVVEVKLQLARTVDLGLELPSSNTPIASLDGRLAARDVRYAIFYGERDSPVSFTVTSLVLTTGAEFFTEYQQFGGRVSNSKLQLRLPSNFYRS